jgi:hypothetical protein
MDDPGALIVTEEFAGTESLSPLKTAEALDTGAPFTKAELLTKSIAPRDSAITDEAGSIIANNSAIDLPATRFTMVFFSDVLDLSHPT